MAYVPLVMVYSHFQPDHSQEVWHLILDEVPSGRDTHHPLSSGGECRLHDGAEQLQRHRKHTWEGAKHLLLTSLFPQSPRAPEPIADENRQRSTSRQKRCLTSLQTPFRTIIIQAPHITLLVLCSRNKQHSSTKNLLRRRERTIGPQHRKQHHHSWIIHHHLSMQMVQQNSYLQKWWAKDLLQSSRQMQSVFQVLWLPLKYLHLTRITVPTQAITWMNWRQLSN